MAGTSLPPQKWIPWSIIAFICFIINLIIVRHEYIKRKSNIASFTTKSDKYNSMLCIIFGIIYCFVSFTSYFDGFCYFSYNTSLSFLSIQGGFMGFYQISRLKYCFANDQVYSNKGYPNWLFTIMYISGVIIIAFIIIDPWIAKIPIHCGIDEEWNYQDAVAINDKYTYRIPFQIGSFWAWDLFTLSLYITKVISFRKYKVINKNVHQRIMMILWKIIILTGLYQITFIFTIITMIISSYIFVENLIFLILSQLFGHGISVTVSYSMYLMQNHNHPKYEAFLRRYRLCFCCQGLIYQDDIQNDQKKNESDKEEPKDSTLYETHDISTKHGRIETRDIDTMSVETIFI